MTAEPTSPPTSPQPAVTGGGSAANAADDLPALADAESAASLVSSLLDTAEGRGLIARGLAEQSGISLEAAECFVATIDADSLVAMTALGVDAGAAGLASVPPEARAEILRVVETCGIAPETLLG